MDLVILFNQYLTQMKWEGPVENASEKRLLMKVDVSDHMVRQSVIMCAHIANTQYCGAKGSIHEYIDESHRAIHVGQG